MELEITKLDWDSDFFEQKIGSVQLDKLTKTQLADIVKKKKEEKFDLIYLFISEMDPVMAIELEEAGATLVDQKITYHKMLTSPLQILIHFEEFEGQLNQQLIDLALASGHKSRFFKDPRTQPYFADLYERWIENSVTKKVADVVLVSRQDGEISSLVTIKIKDQKGTIGLLAVDKEHRGKGIGKELLKASESWLARNNCSEIFVATQRENKEACALYERGGYKVINSQYIFHY